MVQFNCHKVYALVWAPDESSTMEVLLFTVTKHFHLSCVIYSSVLGSIVFFLYLEKYIKYELENLKNCLKLVF